MHSTYIKYHEKNFMKIFVFVKLIFFPKNKVKKNKIEIFFFNVNYVMCTVCKVYNLIIFNSNVEKACEWNSVTKVYKIKTIERYMTHNIKYQ